MPKPASERNSPDRKDTAELRFVWVTARRDGECAECSLPITHGDKILWDKHFHKAYCVICGEEIAE